MILAIDQATVSGVCFGVAGCERPEWRILQVKSSAPGEALSRFRYHFSAILHEVRPTAVWRESTYFPRHGGKGPPINIATLARLFAIAETIDALCFELGIRDCFEVTPAEVSRSFLGGAQKLGRDQKKRAYIARCAAYGCEGVPSDAADALAIWFMAEAHIDPVAASRRRAAIGQELALHPVAPAKPAALASEEEARHAVDLFSATGPEVRPGAVLRLPAGRLSDR